MCFLLFFKSTLRANIKLNNTLCFRASWIGLVTDELCWTGGCGSVAVNNSVCSESCLSESHPAYQRCLCRSRWRWVDGSSMDYMNWYRIEPTGQSSQLCGALSAASDQWFDNFCSSSLTRPFICKRPRTDTQGECKQMGSLNLCVYEQKRLTIQRLTETTEVSRVFSRMQFSRSCSVRG